MVDPKPLLYDMFPVMPLTAWEQIVSEDMDGTTINIVPVNDRKEHVMGEECWCRPSVDHTKYSVTYTHNSLDRRELYENAVH